LRLIACDDRRGLWQLPTTAQRAFKVLPPHHRVVERTFAWISKHRRSVRDYERLPEHHEAMVKWAMIALMGPRPARQPRPRSRPAPPWPSPSPQPHDLNYQTSQLADWPAARVAARVFKAIRPLASCSKARWFSS
jgi:hypothetical protein